MIEYNEYTRENLKGPVKQLKEEHYTVFVNDGLTYIGKPIDGEHHYNNRLIVFDEQHNVRETELFLIDKVTKWVFDNTGKITESITYESEKKEGIISKNIHNYSNNGLTHEIIGYDSKNEQTYRFLSTYDTQKRALEKISYNKKNEIEDRVVWEYTGDFRSFSKVTIYNADNTLRRITEHKLNQQGHFYEVIEYNEKGVVTKTKDYRYLYNSDGTPKETSRQNELLHQHTAVIEEDQYGNWIKKLIYYKKKPVYIHIRNYCYFNEESITDTLDSNIKQINEALTLRSPKTIVATYWDAKHSINTLDEYERVDIDLTSKELKMVVNKSADADKFSYFTYYAATNNLFPSIIECEESYIEVLALLDNLEGLFEVSIVHSSSMYINWRQQMNSYTIKFYDHPGYLLHVSNINFCEDDEYEFSSHLTDYETYEYGYLNLGQITILHPPKGSGMRDEDFEEQLFDCINDCEVEDKPEQPNIHIVEVINNSFQLVRHTIDNDFEINNLDVNYGYGFQGFHDDLMKRFITETKGLVLFHGIPGTGKTYYIRHLLREMALTKKIAIYMPPNMVDYLTDPSFISFLARTVKGYTSKNQFCVLLIEDAEPLLAQRESESRIQGVTNLLNMTDGLLNDMLKLQMICTFNVELNKLDAALLRPGRLIARKEFKPLSVLDANRLAQRLGIKKEIKTPTTLSQIYAMLEGKNTIIHNPNENE